MEEVPVALDFRSGERGPPSPPGASAAPLHAAERCADAGKASSIRHLRFSSFYGRRGW